jgi:signal transduction histidine kinase
MSAGMRMSHEGDGVEAIVRQTERSARLDTFEGARGLIAELARASGVRVAVGAPIVVEGRLWGVVSAGWNSEEPPPADTEERMAEFAELLDTAIANADSRDQLRASRSRLLTAADDARRQVVRDLHDGAQQRFVHSVLNLRLAQRALGGDNGETAELLEAAIEQAQQGNAELRELSHGILPAVLTNEGLGAAVDTVVARLRFPVEVDIPADRFTAEIEASAYFIVAESLTNVVKHSQATYAEVIVSVEDGSLNIEVRDDGVGGADPTGHGLVGLADRATALGGRLTVQNGADRGTVVCATLPVSQ